MTEVKCTTNTLPTPFRASVSTLNIHIYLLIYVTFRLFIFHGHRLSYDTSRVKKRTKNNFKYLDRTFLHSFSQFLRKPLVKSIKRPLQSTY